MTDTRRCEPPEELRGRDGWHWIAMYSYERPLWWSGDHELPAWISPGGGRVSAETAQSYTYRYIAPVSTPSEVDALRAEVADTDRLLLATQEDLGNAQAEAQHWATRTTQINAEAEALKAEVAHWKEVARNALHRLVDSIDRAALSQPEGKE